MKKAKRNVIISAIMAIALCVSLMAGATFALFTDKSEVNIAVTSGKVKLVATIDEGWTTYSGVELTGDAATDRTEKTAVNGTFTNGGFASIDENKITLSNVTPGDKIEFNITLKNYSTIKTQYRTSVKKVANADETASDDTLFNALKFTVGGMTIEDSSNWKVLKAAASEGEVVETYACSVELPSDVENKECEDKTCTISFIVEAVQSNVKTSVKTATVEAGDEATMNEEIKNILKNAVTTDAEGEYKSTDIALPANCTVTIDSGATSVPQGKTKDITISGDKSSVVKLENTAPGSEGKLSYQDGANLTFLGVTVNANGISGICARGGIVTFKDCKIEGELKQTIGSKFVFSGCTFTEPVSQVGYGCKEVVFENCTFNTDGYGIKIYSEGSSPVNLIVKNCEFINNSGAAKSAIFIDHISDGISYNISVENCKFDGFTLTPTENYNKWATRMIITDSFVQTTEGQYVFSYQTGEESGNYYKLLDSEHLTVVLDGVRVK